MQHRIYRCRCWRDSVSFEFSFSFGIVCIARIYIGILNYIISLYLISLVALSQSKLITLLGIGLFFDGNCCLHRVLNSCVCLVFVCVWQFCMCVCVGVIGKLCCCGSVYRSVTSTPSVGHNCPRRKCERDGLLGCCWLCLRRYRVSDFDIFRCTEIKRKKLISKIITTMSIIFFLFFASNYLIPTEFVLALRKIEDFKACVE